MNAKIGPNNEGLEHVMGRHGIGNMNENGELFSQLCANYDLIIGGTVFPHKNVTKCCGSHQTIQWKTILII